MAIELKFINFIVRKKTIAEKYPGGWVQCLDDHQTELERGIVRTDGELWCDTAMNPDDIETAIMRWVGVRALCP